MGAEGVGGVSGEGAGCAVADCAADGGIPGAGTVCGVAACEGCAGIPGAVGAGGEGGACAVGCAACAGCSPVCAASPVPPVRICFNFPASAESGIESTADKSALNCPEIFVRPLAKPSISAAFACVILILFCNIKSARSGDCASFNA